MTIIEFKNYVEKKLNKELFEEAERIRIEQMIEENNGKQISSSQKKDMVKQMWNQIIENTYINMKNSIKKKATEEDWKNEIDELVGRINYLLNES